MPSLRRTVATLATTLTLASEPVGAQGAPTPGEDGRARPTCDGGVAPGPRALSMLTLAAADAEVPFDTVPEAAWGSVRFLTELAANHARRRLGAPDGDLAPLDSARREAEYQAHVHLVARPDGSVRWTYPWNTPGHPPRKPSPLPAGYELLAHAVDTLLRDGGGFQWPERVVADSIAFVLMLDWPMPDGRGSVSRIAARHGAALGPLLVGVATPVTLRRAAGLTLSRYATPGVAPRDMDIVMQFVVGTDGRAVESTIKDYWPDGVERLQGLELHAYEQFLRAVTRHLRNSSYTPATVGGCPVPQPVTQVFRFSLGG